MFLVARLVAAIAFYTCIPLPSGWSLDFRKVACLAPLVGLLIGGLLAGADLGLNAIGMPILPRSAVLVVTWIAITGGLHLDGVIDTADGLGVTDPKRRLSVMAESTTGAFGVLAAVSLLLLKLAALTELNTLRWLILLLVPAWGRWSQQVAIARYPYLKRMGKGAFHKEAIRNLWYAMPSLFLLLGVSVLPIFYFPQSNFLALGLVLGGSAIAFLVPAWFNFKLGGQTGDTYGAVVEWTEAILLIVLTVLESHPW